MKSQNSIYQWLRSALSTHYFSKKIAPQFCGHQSYARPIAGGIAHCSPREKEARLFCIMYKYFCPYKPSEIYQEENSEVLKIAHKKGGNLEDVCDKFFPRAHLKSDEVKNHR